MKPVKVFNSMTRKIEDFSSVNPGKVGIYSCGPTVYSEPHIGNTRTALFNDLLKKMFRLSGYDVKHVMNLTDVGHLTGDSDDGDDKIENEAKKEGMSALQIAQKYTDIFFDFSAKLNCEVPEVVCKATDHIKEQIDFIVDLENKNFTYKTSDGIYFDTSKINDYGKLARLDIKGLRAGQRIEIGEKKNYTDFALWKFSPNDGAKRLQEWDSPWGVGFPGWHIECSAMSMKYLGKFFDIHTGGADLMSVHHTNEIVQNEAYCGCENVKYWMHGGMLVMPSGDKMSKSLGHKQTLKTELIDKGINPLAYRYLCLTAHYRTQLVFSQDALKDSAIALKRLQLKCLNIKKLSEKSSDLSEKSQQMFDRICAFLFNDLDIPQSLVAFRDALDFEISASEKLFIIEKIDSVFSLDLLKEEKIEISLELQNLLDLRATARLEKNWAESDKLRDEIKDKFGFCVKDEKSGQTLE